MARQVGQDLDEIPALLWREASRRLIEENEAGRARERQGDLQLTLLSIGKLRNQRLPAVLQMHRLDQVMGGLHQRIAAARPKQGKAAPGDAAAGEIDVVDHAEAGEEQRNLIGPAQAAADPFM